jgi:hypothetical protein
MTYSAASSAKSGLAQTRIGKLAQYVADLHRLVPPFQQGGAFAQPGGCHGVSPRVSASGKFNLHGFVPMRDMALPAGAHYAREFPARAMI